MTPAYSHSRNPYDNFTQINKQKTTIFDKIHIFTIKKTRIKWKSNKLKQKVRIKENKTKAKTTTTITSFMFRVKTFPHFPSKTLEECNKQRKHKPNLTKSE